MARNGLLYALLAMAYNSLCIRVYMRREDIGTATLFHSGCSFTLPPIDSTQVGGIKNFHYNFLKISLFDTRDKLLANRPTFSNLRVCASVVPWQKYTNDDYSIVTI